ncbi:hypothetical protein HIC20_00605 [Buchnera aphidicola (Hormaphis cornu)]|nr:hypothetical protein HIC20_00605 [Buchnera aphidicola (Hormaphis cornu)]
MLTLKTSNEIEEIARETIKINFQKLKIKFTLNIDYILDILNIIQKDSIYLSFKNPISTIQIQDNINSNELFIIMPLKF